MLPKIRVTSKNGLVKVVEHWIPYKKVKGPIRLSPPGVELGDSKDCYHWNIIMCKNEEIDSLLASTLALPKIHVTPKNAVSKSCWALKSAQKSQRALMFISSRSGARGLQRLPSLKYYNVQKWQSIFTLGLNSAKNTCYIQKCFK